MRTGNYSKSTAPSVSFTARRLKKILDARCIGGLLLKDWQVWGKSPDEGGTFERAGQRQEAGDDGCAWPK